MKRTRIVKSFLHGVTVVANIIAGEAIDPWHLWHLDRYTYIESSILYLSDFFREMK